MKIHTSYKTLYVGKFKQSSCISNRSANNVYKLCGLITSYLRLMEKKKVKYSIRMSVYTDNNITKY